MGLLLTIPTFGGSDALAGTSAAGAIAAALAEATFLSETVAGIVVAVGVGGVTGMAFDGAVQITAFAYGDQDGFNVGQFVQNGAFGAATGFVGAGVAVVVTRASGAVAEAAPGLARVVKAVGNTLSEVPAPLRQGVTGMVAGGGMAAALDQVTTGHVNAQDVLIGVVAGGAGGAVTGAAAARAAAAAGAAANVLKGVRLAVGGARALEATSKVVRAGQEVKTVEAAGEGDRAVAAGDKDVVYWDMDVSGWEPSIYRRPPPKDLNAEQIQQVMREFREIGGDPAMLMFNKGFLTSYWPGYKLITVMGDVFPNLEGVTANARLSTRAVLAHELGHAHFDGEQLGTIDEEVGASLWAAENVPNLSFEERLSLINDARERGGMIPEGFIRDTLARDWERTTERARNLLRQGRIEQLPTGEVILSHRELE